MTIKSRCTDQLVKNLMETRACLFVLATLLFPLALQIFSDEPPPPGPRVPMAALL